MWSIFRLLLVMRTYRKSVRSTGIRWQWQQVFPKTEPCPKPLHCWSPSFQAFETSFSLPFPFMPLGCLGQ